MSTQRRSHDSDDVQHDSLLIGSTKYSVVTHAWKLYNWRVSILDKEQYRAICNSIRPQPRHLIVPSNDRLCKKCLNRITEEDFVLARMMG